MRPAHFELTLERDDQLQQLGRLLDDATDAAGRLAIVEGPAGIGKSRVLDDAARAAAGAGFLVLRASGAELEQEYPAGVVLHLLERTVLTGAPKRREHLLRAQARAATPIFDTSDATNTDPGSVHRFALLHGLYWLVLNLAEEQPLAIIVDDVHWADDFSVQFLNYIANRIADLPVALMVAVRTGDTDHHRHLTEQLYQAHDVELVKVSALSKSAVSTMLDSFSIPNKHSPALVDAIATATGGNAFYIREMLAHLAEQPDDWHPESPGLPIFAPESVGRNVLGRLRRHGPDATAVARAASVLADDAALHRVAALAQISPARALAAAQELVSSTIFRAAGPVAFAHPIVRAAVHAEMPARQRLELYQQAARQSFEANEDSAAVAQYLMSASPTTERWARDSLYAAAVLARRRGSPEMAVRYLRRSLEDWPAGDNPSDVLIELAMAEAVIGEPTSIARFIDALDRIDSPASRVLPLYALGHTLYRRGRHREAAETFSGGVAMYAPHDPQTALRFESAYAACAHYVPAQRPEAMLRLEHEVGTWTAHDNSTAQRMAKGILALYRAGSTPGSDAVSLVEEALIGLNKRASDMIGSIETNLALTALIWSGHPAAVLPHIDYLITAARDRGDVMAYTEASFIRALSMHRLGRISEAMESARIAVDGTRQGWGATTPGPQGILADCLLHYGDREGAAELVREASRLAAVNPSRPTNCWAHWATARLYITAGQPAAAVKEFIAAGRRLSDAGITSPGVLNWHGEAAAAALASDNPALAEEIVNAGLQLGAEFALPDVVASALWAQARGQDHRQAITTLTAAAELVQDDGSLVLARVLTDLGGRQRRSGRVIEARVNLRMALEITTRVGAHTLADFARGELQSAGARPRRDRLTGISALTATEDRVARLVAAGSTNRAVAETLFLTKNTVEWHLRNVYRKLNVGSRHDLGERLTAEDQPN